MRAARLSRPERCRDQKCTCTSSPESVGGPRAGETGGVAATRVRSHPGHRPLANLRFEGSRLLPAVCAVSLIKAMSRMSPPYAGHSKGRGWFFPRAARDPRTAFRGGAHGMPYRRRVCARLISGVFCAGSCGRPWWLPAETFSARGTAIRRSPVVNGTGITTVLPGCSCRRRPQVPAVWSGPSASRSVVSFALEPSRSDSSRFITIACSSSSGVNPKGPRPLLKATRLSRSIR